VGDRGWNVYLLECAGGSLYCGIAKDVDKRLVQHNSGKGSKFVGGTPSSQAGLEYPHRDRTRCFETGALYQASLQASKTSDNQNSEVSPLMLSADQIEVISVSFGEPIWYSCGGVQINVPCPMCPARGRKVDRTGHLGINLSLNKAHCVRCGWGHGDARKWLRDFRNLAINVVDVSDLDGDFLRDIERTPPPFDHLTLNLPRGLVPFHKGHLETPYGQSLIDKHLTPGQMTGLYAGESGPYEGYVVFPFYEHGELVYYQGRGAFESIISDKSRKKKNPDKIAAPLGKAYWLYGYDDAVPQGTAFLCEGTLSRISLHRVVKVIDPTHYAVGLQGSTMSFPDDQRHFFNSQFGKLWSLKPKQVFVCLDDDAWKASQELASIINSFGMPCRAIPLVGGDPNDIPPRSLFNQIKASIDDESDLGRTILDLKMSKPI
jgi:putative endonuclease